MGFEALEKNHLDLRNFDRSLNRSLLAACIPGIVHVNLALAISDQCFGGTSPRFSYSMICLPPSSVDHSKAEVRIEALEENHLDISNFDRSLNRPLPSLFGRTMNLLRPASWISRIVSVNQTSQLFYKLWSALLGFWQGIGWVQLHKTCFF